MSDEEDPDDYHADMARRMTLQETRWEAFLPTLATKADLADTRSELKTEMAELRTEMRVGFADLKAELQKGINETQRWMIATIIGLFLGFAGMFFAMTNALR